MWGVNITSGLELELVLSQNREREALMSHVSTHFIIRNEAVCRHGDWILSTDWLLWTWDTVSENQRMILSVISHSAWSCWTENTTEAECKHWALVVLTRAPLSSVAGGWTAENTEVRGQRSGPLWPHTTHSNLRTCREFRRDVCRGASAQDELHEVMLVFPFRLLSLKQRRLQEVPSHSVVLLQPHLLPVCVDPEDVFDCTDVIWLWCFSSWIKWIWLEVHVKSFQRQASMLHHEAPPPARRSVLGCFLSASGWRGEEGRTETPSLCPLGAPERLQEVLKYLRRDAARLWWSRCSCWWRSCCCIQISDQVLSSWVVKGALV